MYYPPAKLGDDMSVEWVLFSCANLISPETRVPVEDYHG